MLGVLASGAGYLPLDPQMPDERLRYIVEDAQLQAVIVDAATHERLSGLVDCALYRLDDLLDAPVAEAGASRLASRLVSRSTPADPQRAAYVIYTSGTTGKPKGVVIERGMLAHFIASLTGRYRRDESTRWLQFASVNFDASVLEIFNPLTHGGHLIVAPEAVRTDAEALSGFLDAERITHGFLPPAILKLLPRRALPHLDTILCGGEASDDETIRFWSGVLRLSNIYGPTEATVMATDNTFDGDKPANQLGHPLPGYQIHLLDEEGEAVPLGAIGEICIGGAAVSRGYLLAARSGPGRSSACNPFGPGRLYRSGWPRPLPAGRRDRVSSVVKRFSGEEDTGYRIELGEIEGQHRRAAGGAQRVCRHVCERQGGTALVAWRYGRGIAGMPKAVLRSGIAFAQRLAHYMVPAFLLPIEALPLDAERQDRPRQIAGAASRSGRPREPRFRCLRTGSAGNLVGGAGRAARERRRAQPFLPVGRPLVTRHARVQSRQFELARAGQTEDAALSIRSSTFFAQAGAPECRARCRAAAAQRTAWKEPMPAPADSRLVRMMHTRTLSKPDDNAYNIVMRVDFGGAANPLRLHQALVAVLTHNPIFNMSFAERDGQLLDASSVTAAVSPTEVRALC